MLTDAKASYYIYLKCPVNDYTNGRYLISEDAVKMEAVAGYYYFLVGILNSEDDEANRSFVEMFGFTEILPGRITTNKIVSANGIDFWDLANSIMKIGTEDSGFDWGVSQEKQLTVRGRFESNKANDRIVIDPVTKSLQLLNPSGKILGQFYFRNLDEGGESVLRTNFYNRLGELSYYSSVGAGGISSVSLDYETGRDKFWSSIGGHLLILNSGTNNSPRFSVNTASIHKTIEIIMDGLPTSPTGLNQWQLWRDGDIIKIVV